MSDDRLETMFLLQNAAQYKFYEQRGGWPTVDDAARMERIREAALGVTSELMEALGETGWKPWAKYNHINRQAFAGELVDMLKFWMNLCLLGGVTPDDIYAGFIEKHTVNIQRQEDGYDGVTTKCPRCKRAYDDPAVKCTPVHAGPDGAGPAWCDRDRICVPLEYTPRAGVESQ